MCGVSARPFHVRAFSGSERSPALSTFGLLYGLLGSVTTCIYDYALRVCVCYGVSVSLAALFESVLYEVNLAQQLCKFDEVACLLASVTGCCVSSAASPLSP